MLKIANKANWPTKPCGSFLVKFPAGLPFFNREVLTQARYFCEPVYGQGRYIILTHTVYDIQKSE